MKHELCRRLSNLFPVLVFLFCCAAPTSAQDEFFEPSTTLGGYGELHYNLEDTDQSPAEKKLDFHRFVLFYSHSWTEKWSFKAEVELEHNFVTTGKGELGLEQAAINYRHSEAFGFQAGVVLPSIGLLNELHEPPVFLSVERPDYSKYIIPTTWAGNGVSLFGKKNGFDYKLTVMEGLNADAISNESGIRGARLKGYQADARELLYTGRLNYIAIPGFLTGLSFTKTKAMGTVQDIPLTLMEFHGQVRKKGIHANFEWGGIDYDKGSLQKSRGFYFDLGYDMAAKTGFSGALIPWFRFADYNTAASTSAGGDSEEAQRYSKWLMGLTLKPIDEVVFKIEYGYQKNGLTDREQRLFNLGAGYMF